VKNWTGRVNGLLPPKQMRRMVLQQQKQFCVCGVSMGNAHFGLEIVEDGKQLREVAP
jgi:hypothetical protein